MNGIGHLLVDTGANVSAISCDALENDGDIRKSVIPMKACAGHWLPVVIGYVKLDIFVDGIQWPSYTFWAVDCSFRKYDGILGTDIQKDLDTVIDCGSKTLTIHSIKNDPITVQLKNADYLEEYAQIRELMCAMNEKIDDVEFEAMPMNDQEILAGRAEVLKCRLKPDHGWLNSLYFVQGAV
jgi:hypothetical protein